MRSVNHNFSFLIKVLILTGIPFCIFYFSLGSIKDREKDWYGAGYDPSYAYLYNSLNVATFRLIGHFDHPGTPMQITGAVILPFAWMFHDNGGKSLTEDVLGNPEYYLRVLNISTAVIASLCLFLLGVFLLSKTDKYWIAQLFQLTPFVTGIILYNGFMRTSQESMLLIASLSLAAICLVWLLNNTIAERRLLLIFGIISGFGLASKIIFAPLVLIPFFLFETARQRKQFLKIAVISFILFTLPAIPRYPNMAWWIIRLFIHSGIYGSGSMTIIEPVSYFSSFKGLLMNEPVYLAFFAISLLTALILLFGKAFLKNWFSNKELKLTVLIVIAQTLGYILTAKHPKTAYLLPYECLSFIPLILVINNLTSKLNSKVARSLSITVAVVISGIILIPHGFNERNKLFTLEENENYEQAWQFTIQKGNVVIGINPGPSPVAAAFFANTYSSNQYGTILTKLYPKYYIFDTYKQRLTNFEGEEVYLSFLKSNCSSIAVIGSNLEDFEPLLNGNQFADTEKFIPGKAEVGILQCK